MALHKFEGDISDLSDRQLEFIDNILQKHGFTECKVTIEPVGKAGDNFIGSIKRIIVDGNNESLSMIAKTLPPVEGSLKEMNIAFFKNEHLMYTEILPSFVQLQKSVGVPETEHLKYAKCYGSSLEQSHEIILLEDLKVLEFTMLDKFQPLTNNCVKSFLKNFAILHSLSFVMKQKDPEKFNTFKANLTNIMALKANDMEIKFYFKALEDGMKSTLENPAHKDLVSLSDYSNTILEFSKMEHESKYSVVVQGDAWTNNIMFKYTDDEVPESIMIDYQLSKNCSPVYDILYMMICCTNYDSRKQYYYDWIDYYHAELEKSLLNFSLNVDVVYPREQLDADLKLYGKFMFLYSIFMYNIQLRQSEDAENLMEGMKNIGLQVDKNEEQVTAISALDKTTTALVKTRVTELINSFLEFGLLQIL